MRTLLTLLVLIVAPLMTLVPGGDPPAVRAQTPEMEGCLSVEPDPALPQFIEVAAEFVECITVDDVRAVFNSTVPMQVSLTIDGRRWAEVDRGAGPVQVTQWRDGSVIFVTLTRSITPVSLGTFTPHRESVTLDQRLETGTYTLHVNAVVLELSIPAKPPTSEQAPPVSPPPAEPPEGDGVGTIRSHPTIQAVQVSTDLPIPVRITLHVAGTHAFPGDGCASALQIRQNRSGNRVEVELYRLIDTTLSCTTERERIDQTIRLRGSFEPGTYQVRVNNHTQIVTIPLSPPPPPPPPPPDPIRREALIDSVEVLLSDRFMYPARLTLHITGYWPDGCGGAQQIEQRRLGEQVWVAIYRYADPAIMCPAMLQRVDEYVLLDGGFAPGTYWIQVNDFWLSYTLPPGPQPYDPQPMPGGSVPGAES